MKQAPSKAMEKIAGWLTPPVRREEVLGDLCERYRGLREYVLDVLRTVPHVVGSQIRRVTDWRLVLLEGMALYVSLAGGEWYAGGPAALTEAPKAPALVIPAVITLAALRVVDAYAHRGEKSVTKLVLEPALALLATAAAETILAAANPALAVGWAVLIPGGIVALVLLSMLRAAMPSRQSMLPAGAPGGEDPDSAEDIQQQVQEFGERIRRRNRVEYIAAGFSFAVFGISIYQTPHWGARAGSALIIAGAAYAMYQLWKKGSPGTLPAHATLETCIDFHRRELMRQRDLLHRIWLWYLGPLLPGSAVLFAGALFSQEARVRGIFPVLAGGAMFVIILLFIWKVNQNAERRLQQQIETLDAIASRR